MERILEDSRDPAGLGASEWNVPVTGALEKKKKSWRARRSGKAFWERLKTEVYPGGCFVDDSGIQAQSSTGSVGSRTEARKAPSEPNVLGGVRTGDGDRKWEAGFPVRLRHPVKDSPADKRG